MTDETLELLVKHSPNVEIIKLDLTGCLATDRGLVMIAPHCRQLKEIHLANGFITHEGLLALSVCCRHLQSITICCPRVLTAKAVTLLCQQGVISLVDGMQPLLKASPHLRYLFFQDEKHYYYDSFNLKLSDQLVKTLIHSCPCLALCSQVRKVTVKTVGL